MNDVLQAMARRYLVRLRTVAERRGLRTWLDAVIKANRKNECEATEKEVRMLSRMCDDASVNRAQVPELLGKSYRRCVEDGDFERLRTNRRNRGIYDKVSVSLLAARINKRNNKDKRK